MLTKERYELLKQAMGRGANLPPCDLEEMAEYEKAPREHHRDLSREAEKSKQIPPTLTEAA
jgi:hypothetical protein